MPHNLIKHSSVIFLAIATANALTYLFHIFAARALGPASYGEFGSFMAVFMILSVPVATIETVTTRFVAREKSRGEHGKIGSLMFSAVRKLSLYGAGVFVLISLTSPFIADFLHSVSPLPVVIAGLAVLFSVILPVSRGVLQGTQKFNSLALNIVLESLFRLGAGIVLIMIGWGVPGAVLAFGIASLAAFLIAFMPLKFYWDKRDPKINVREIYRFTAPVLFAVSFVSILVNGPTIYVRHFYSAEFAGHWNAALNLARVILFLGASISLVMFGKISLDHDKNDEREKKMVFKKSLFYLVLVSLTLSTLFLLFSQEILVTLFGDSYSPGAALLKWMGFAVSSIAVLHLGVSYWLGTMSSGPGALSTGYEKL